MKVMMNDNGEEVEIKELIRFICPFCGAKCSVTEEKETGEPGVLHSLPTCRMYDDNPIDEYLHQVNIQYGAHN